MFFAQLIATANTLADDTIYKSLDAEGNTVFTDQPVENAVIITPPPLNIADSPTTGNTGKAFRGSLDLADEPLNGRSSGTTGSAVASNAASNISMGGLSAVAADPVITEISIAAPLSQETMTDAPSPFWVELHSKPVSIKDSGLVAEVWLDGALAVRGKRSMLPVEMPDRGTHQLQVRLVDKKGSTVIESDPQPLYIKRSVAR
ncbi:MAG: DUF4124 domain-containing protein [Granulosicoccus sp.]